MNDDLVDQPAQNLEGLGAGLFDMQSFVQGGDLAPIKLGQLGVKANRGRGWFRQFAGDVGLLGLERVKAALQPAGAQAVCDGP